MTRVYPVIAAVPMPDANPGKDTKGRVGSKIVLSGQDSKAYGERRVEKMGMDLKQAPDDLC